MDLVILARHCTERENDAEKVERLVSKSAASLLLEGRVGDRFDGVVTGASPKGTWVRVLAPPVEGRIAEGAGGLDVGDRVRVQLIHTDVDMGYIDFRQNESLSVSAMREQSEAPESASRGLFRGPGVTPSSSRATCEPGRRERRR